MATNTMVMGRNYMVIVERLIICGVLIMVYGFGIFGNGYAEDKIVRKPCGNSELAEWKIVIPPPLALSDVSRMLLEDCRWHISQKDNGDILVKNLHDEEVNFPFDVGLLESSGHSSDYDIFKLIDGWLVVRDEGEFGGDSRWYSVDGAKSTMIVDAPVKWLSLYDERYFMLTGNDIDSTYGGSFGGMYFDGIRWSYDQFETFSELPVSAAKQDSGKYVVLTQRALYLVDVVNRTKKILHKGEWWKLNPTSVVVKSDGVYIGLTKYIVKLSYLGDEMEETWLMHENNKEQ